MKIHICSRLSVPAINQTIPVWDFLFDLGHSFTLSETIPTEKPDAIVVMGVGAIGPGIKSVEMFPNVPLFVYNWDCYTWCWENPRPGEYDYTAYYEQLVKKAKEVWVPSECTGIQQEKIWGITNWKTVLCSVPYWEYEDTTDYGYALCCLREIPDKQWDWFERACVKLNIPYQMTNHKRTYKEYQETVAHCKFLVSHMHELSTGGLSIVEGFYLGKPSLLSDSPHHGGKDYLGNNATYFNHTNFDDFLFKLENMMIDPPKLSVEACKKEVVESFSSQVMVANIARRLESCLV